MTEFKEIGNQSAECTVLGFFKEDSPHRLAPAMKHKISLLHENEQTTLFVNCGSKEHYKEADLAKLLGLIITETLDFKSLYLQLPKPEELESPVFCEKLVRYSLQATSKPFALKRQTASGEKVKSSIQTIFLDAVDAEAVKQGIALSSALDLTKELGDRPANLCTPSFLADCAVSLSQDCKNLSSKILEEKDMQELQMNALLAVSQGSKEPAKLIELHYQGADKSQQPYVFVGKGITFDSGGLSLKPPAGMVEMKYDMCGAASVLGLMKAVSELSLPINVIGIIAASENLPGSEAVKPSDVVTSMSGQTVEILNTDAEGRLVLCDALTYARQYKPKTIVDIATLTGAMIIALGHHTNGIMSNDDTLCEKLLSAGKKSNDKAWQLPIWEEYDAQIDSNVADIANIGSDRSAGSITAACFLARFCKDVSWAHIDCAGTAWVSGKNKAATGRPLPLLLQYLVDESKAP